MWIVDRKASKQYTYTLFYLVAGRRVRPMVGVRMHTVHLIVVIRPVLVLGLHQIEEGGLVTRRTQRLEGDT